MTTEELIAARRAEPWREALLPMLLLIISKKKEEKESVCFSFQ